MTFDIQRHVRTGKGYPRCCDPIECVDGFTASIQASDFHYCIPRDNHGPYKAFEIGFPSQKDDLIQEYAEDPTDPTGTVYGGVPASVVVALIAKHGGVKESE